MSLRLTIHSPEGGTYDVTFDEPRVRVGRASFCELRLPYPVVSSHHLTIRRDDSDWWFVDEGSTNGTVVDGTRLEPANQVWIYDGLEAVIVDVKITFEVVRDRVEGFTLAESGTLLRQMVHDSAAAGTDELAFLEVLEGPGRGRRFAIPDEAEEAMLGPGSDCALRMDELEVPVLCVGREGEGFRAWPASDSVQLTVDDMAVDADGHHLSSSQRLQAGPLVLVFVDPLEAYLDEMSDALDQPVADGAAEDADDVPNRDDVASVELEMEEEAPPPATPTGLTPLEWVLLVGSILVIVGGVGALLVILGVV